MGEPGYNKKYGYCDIECTVGIALTQHNAKVIAGNQVTSMEQCVDLCKKETDFTCRSCEWDSDGEYDHVCNLSIVNKDMVYPNEVDATNWKRFEYCTMNNRKMETNWRTDKKCGLHWTLPSGQPALCNPFDKNGHCCQHGRCGNPNSKCQCSGCNGNGVWCGGHRALSCEECPQGHGYLWCNGQCQWEHMQDKCVPKQ